MALNRCVNPTAPARSAAVAWSSVASLWPRNTRTPAAASAAMCAGATISGATVSSSGAGKGAHKFGDVGVGRRREIIRIVDAAARRGDERTLHMQAADAGHALCQRVAHGLHRRAPQRRRPADQRGQQRGGAEARVRGGDAAQRVGGRCVVEQHAAAAVHLQIDESRRQDDIVRQRRRRRHRAARGSATAAMRSPSSVTTRRPCSACAVEQTCGGERDHGGNSASAARRWP